MTFKEWMEVAREKLRNCLPDSRQGFVHTLVSGFEEDVEQDAIGPDRPNDRLEVRGRLREYCDMLGKDLSGVEYQECATCAAKTGSPALCPSCLHNRGLVMDLQARLAAVGKDLDEAYKRITGLRGELSNVALERDQWKSHAEDRDRGFEMEVRRRQAAEADRDALRVSYRAELEGSAKLREKYGAREDETFAAFVERLAAQRDVYADEARCLRKRLEGMAEVLGVPIDGVVGAVNGAIYERFELREACEHERQMSKALASKLHESRTLLAQSQNESDGRHRALLELEAERRKDWQRAENAEAAPRCSGGSCFGGVRDQLSEAIGSLMSVCVGNPTVKGLPEIVDDLRRVRDMLAMMAGEPRLAR